MDHEFKEQFLYWLTNDKTLIAGLFIVVLLTWSITREKELFRLLDMILSALFGWGASKLKSKLTGGGHGQS